MSKRGITIAGNIIVDIVKTIDCYPQMGMLAYVEDAQKAIGGCVPNTAIDLKKIDCSISIDAIGCVGADENGKYAIEQLVSHDINVEGIRRLYHADTSFCDVMSLPTGERTFFHRKGANAGFSPDDIDIKRLNCDILHIGYILLLEKFDEDDAEYGTVMARFLHDVQEKGIKTSIDVVSDSSADYGKKIIPTLKYCNYVIINEVECCNIWKLQARHEDGILNQAHVREAMEKTAEAGVADKVIVHSRECGFVLDVKTGDFSVVGSLKIPTEEIKGSVGAGDAFCAGCLYGLYHHYSDKEILEFASASAACNLFSANSIDGIKSKDEILEMANTYQRIYVEDNDYAS